MTSEVKELPQILQDLYFMIAGALFALPVQAYFNTSYQPWEYAASILGGFMMMGVVELHRRLAK
jgi:hypothetical protein